MRRSGVGVVLAVAVAGCSGADPEGRAGEGAGGYGSEWLKGDAEERFERVAKHLRGFDLAMVEVGHRYAELHWAGVDRNWEYAGYQLEKIETAIANGVERRPLRAASARMLEGAVEGVRGAIEARDGAAFDAAFEGLTVTCNACHVAEQVPHFYVGPPEVRSSVVRPRPAADEHEGGAGR